MRKISPSELCDRCRNISIGEDTIGKRVADYYGFEGRMYTGCIAMLVNLLEHKGGCTQCARVLRSAYNG